MHITIYIINICMHIMFRRIMIISVIEWRIRLRGGRVHVVVSVKVVADVVINPVSRNVYVVVILDIVVHLDVSVCIHIKFIAGGR